VSRVLSTSRLSSLRPGPINGSSCLCYGASATYFFKFRGWGKVDVPPKRWPTTRTLLCATS